MQDKAISNEYKERIVAAYWGATYSYRNEWGRFTDKVGCFHWQEHCKLDSFRLRLFQLSDITDEHCKELSENVLGLGITDRNPLIYCGQAEVFKNINRRIVRDSFSSKVADFLRSLGYDLGFAQIPSLIQAGIATKKEGGNG